MQRRTADRAGAIMLALTPPIRHRAVSAASRLKAGAPSGGGPAAIASIGLPLQSRSNPLILRAFLWGYVRDRP